MTATSPVTVATASPSRVSWDLYAIEAALLGCFMISACAVVIALEHPASPVPSMIPSPAIRRAIVGAAMGLTAVLLIYSPWGKRSGALMNPSMTVSVLRMGKLAPRDALGYVAAQFLGASAGVGAMASAARAAVMHPAVRYVATVPGERGTAAAWATEFAIAFLLVTVVFNANRRPKLIHLTGALAGLLVATYITLVGPISGMSMNPARTFGSAVWANLWTGWWVYFTAPVIGMLLATELHLRLISHTDHLCPRLTHSLGHPSQFRCNCLARHASNA